MSGSEFWSNEKLKALIFTLKKAWLHSAYVVKKP